MQPRSHPALSQLWLARAGALVPAGAPVPTVVKPLQTLIPLLILPALLLHPRPLSFHTRPLLLHHLLAFRHLPLRVSECVCATIS
jgi:hypothetical protein